MASTSTLPTKNTGTRPENLSSSNKRTSRQSLLALYSQLLPLAPPPPSYLNTFLSTLPTLNLTTPQIQAVWDELTESIWVRDQGDMQRLWRQGFFGKGFLSRSEPSWKRRVENRRAIIDGKQKRKLSFPLSLATLTLLANLPFLVFDRSHIRRDHSSTSAREKGN